MSTPEREVCACSGTDPDCPNCDGTGVIQPTVEQVRGNPWLVNVFVPEDVPYYRCHPSSHVRCRYCGRRIKRRKIWDHVQEAHGVFRDRVRDPE